MNNYKYIKRCTKAVTMTAAAMLLLTTAGCRRDLWVYQDNFKQVELDIDWRNYFREWAINPNVDPAQDPGGMTVWFFPKDGRTSYQTTTAEVRHFETYLSEGDYDGLVIDYSPSEYGHQEFVGMEYANTAKVQATANSYQADSIPELYGDAAYNGSKPLPKKYTNGLYEIAWEPENIANDTLHLTVNTGKYDRYIPYEERETYQSSLQHQFFKLEPLLIPWNMRVRIYIKGIYYLYGVEGSIAGLADGYYLVDCKTSETPCLLKIDDWEVHLDPQTHMYDNEGGLGYIAKTFKTWGPMNFENRNWDVHVPQRPLSDREYRTNAAIDTYSYEELANRYANEIRINLKFLLRDRHTVKYYHFDVGNLVNVFRNEYALRIDLMDDYNDMPVLPAVEAYNGTGFDGIVVPWENTIEKEVGF
jgi:hypothetical protein